MAFLGSLFDPSKGAGFQAQGTNQGQLNQAFNQNQNAIGQQQAFLNALAGQNGIGNQSSVFNQLQGVANGTGPNPAQAMLNQATGANVANQAVLMAGQRGAGANPGLIARQAAQQGGNLQQQAVGQGATMQANQRLGALNQLGGIAGQQVGQQQGALNALTNAGLTQQGTLAGLMGNQNTANAGIAQGNQKAQSGLFGGILNSVGGALGLADGGQIPDPNQVASPNLNAPPPIAKGPMSSLAKMLGGSSPMPQANAEDPIFAGASRLGSGIASGVKKAAGMAKGGQVHAMVSPGEKYLSPEEAKEVKQNPNKIAEKGEIIPGKAKVHGDSYKNDTVHKVLEAGGIVIPRHVMQSKDAPKKAAAFVAAHLAKGGMVKKSKK